MQRNLQTNAITHSASDVEESTSTGATDGAQSGKRSGDSGEGLQGYTEATNPLPVNGTNVKDVLVKSFTDGHSFDRHLLPRRRN